MARWLIQEVPTVGRILEVDVPSTWTLSQVIGAFERGELLPQMVNLYTKADFAIKEGGVDLHYLAISPKTNEAVKAYNSLSLPLSFPQAVYQLIRAVKNLVNQFPFVEATDIDAVREAVANFSLEGEYEEVV